jgi:hypothetical protein
MLFLLRKACLSVQHVHYGGNVLLDEKIAKRSR